MSTDPTISVVLPTHNGQRYIDTAIESVVSQTYRNWELVIVDDASSDETPAVIAAWAERDSRIRTVRLAENRKLPGALNEGFRQAGGELFTWVSDDNWYAASALERMQEILRAKPQVDVVYADSIWVDAEGNSISREAVRPADELVVGNCVGLCFLYRRKVFEDVGGYDEELFLTEDYDFWLRASLAFQFQPLSEPLHFIRRHPGTLSERYPHEVSLAAEKAVTRWLNTNTGLSRISRGRALETLGLRALIRGDVPAGRRYLLKAMCLLRRPPVFRKCRSFSIDLLFGARVGNWVRRRWFGRPRCRPEPLDPTDGTSL